MISSCWLRLESENRCFVSKRRNRWRGSGGCMGSCGEAVVGWGHGREGTGWGAQWGYGMEIVLILSKVHLGDFHLHPFWHYSIPLSIPLREFRPRLDIVDVQSCAFLILHQDNTSPWVRQETQVSPALEGVWKWQECPPPWRGVYPGLELGTWAVCGWRQEPAWLKRMLITGFGI